MPIRIEYTEDGLGVAAYNEGDVPSKDIFAALNSIYQDERYSKLKYWIRDISKAEKLNLSFEDTKLVGELEAKESLRNPGILLAIVAGTDHTYAISSMFKAFSHKSASDINIFLDRESADTWIFSKLNSTNNGLKSDSDKFLNS